MIIPTVLLHIFWIWNIVMRYAACSQQCLYLRHLIIIMQLCLLYGLGYQYSIFLYGALLGGIYPTEWIWFAVCLAVCWFDFIVFFIVLVKVI